MTTKAQSVAVRFLPSLTDVAFIMPIIFQFNQLGGAPNLLADSDTGWHLRAGEWIMEHGQVPRQDIFSFTHAGQPWFAWEWLWDIAFGSLHKHFGLAAVVVFSMLVICCSSAMLYRLVLRKCPNPLIAIAVTVLADASASIHWLARPHLFTFLFVIIFLGVLDNAYVEALARPKLRDGTEPLTPATKKLLWLLPALTVLWTNIHGGFVAGLIIIGAYAGGGLLNALLEPDGEGRQAILARAKPFVLCGILCTLATLVNPYFIGLHEHVYKYLTDPYFYEHIVEFMSFNFGHPASKYIEPLMLLGVAAACWNLCRRRFEYFLLLAGWLHLGLHAVRNVALYSIVAAPLVGEAIFCWMIELRSVRIVGWFLSLVERFEASASSIAATDRLPRFHLASAAAIVVLTATLTTPNMPKEFQPTHDPKGYPVEAIKVLQRDGDDRIFAHDAWGGYLIYRLYPKIKVFVDGRSDFYGAKFELKYLDILEAKYDWDQNLEHYGIQTALLPADSPLASAMKENRHWRVVYDDKVAIIFRRVKPAHPAQQVSNCPNRGIRENCGSPAAVVATMGAQTLAGSGRSNPNVVAEISPPRLTLLNRP